MAKRLSNYLVEKELVDVGAMEKAFRHRERLGGSLGTNLLELGLLEVERLGECLAAVHDMPQAPKSMLGDIDRSVVRTMRAEDIVRYGALPIGLDGDTLALAVSYPKTPGEHAALREVSGREIKLYLVTELQYQFMAHVLFGLPLTPRFIALVEKFPQRISSSGASASFAQITPGMTEPDAVGGASDLGSGWTPEQFGKFLRKSHSRDEVLQATLGYVGNHFPRRFVLAVQQKSVRGFLAQGVHLSSNRVRAVSFPAEGLIKAFGPGRGVTALIGNASDVGVSPLYESLELPFPAEILCLAIHIGPHPALFIVADNNDEPIERSAEPIIELAATQAAAALMGLVRQRKLQQSAEHQAVGSHSIRELAGRGERTPSVNTLDPGWVLSSGVRGGIKPSLEPARADILSGALGTPLETVGGTLLDPAKMVAAGGEWDNTVFDPVVDRPDEDGLPPEADDYEEEVEPPSNELADIIIELSDPVERAGDSPEDLRKTPATWPARPNAGGFGDPNLVVDGLLSEDPSHVLRARAELLLGAKEVVQALMGRFPGPVDERAPIEAPLSSHGPLLEAVLELGMGAVPHLIDMTGSDNPQRRCYSVLCLRDIRHDHALSPLIDRLTDSSTRVRTAARHALAMYKSAAGFSKVEKSINEAIMSDNSVHQVAGAEAAAEFGQSSSVTLLLENVDSGNTEVAEATVEALKRLTFQDWGQRARKWLKWHKKHGATERRRWLAASVTHKSVEIRTLVADEIERMPLLPVRFDPQAGRREQKRVQRRVIEVLGLDKSK